MASSAVVAFLSFSCVRGLLCSSSPIPSNSATTRRMKVFAPSIVCSILADNSDLLQAAKHTVDTYVKNGMVIGFGSGHASLLAIQYLGQQLRLGALKDIVGIPTSAIGAAEAAKAGIPLNTYQDSSKIDIAFDDADAIEEGTLSAIIGRQRWQGEESLIQEKAVLKAARELVLVVAGKQFKDGLEGSIPVLVRSVGWMETAEEIDDLFLGDAEVWRRPSLGHAGPHGGDFPLVTREGHTVLDVIFTSPISDLVGVAESLDKIDGVVDHGVVSGTPCAVMVVTENELQIVKG